MGSRQCCGLRKFQVMLALIDLSTFQTVAIFVHFLLILGILRPILVFVGNDDVLIL